MKPSTATLRYTARCGNQFFMQPQRLVVPLFQRPYVWNEEIQWEPLWNDVVRGIKGIKADTQQLTTGIVECR